MLHQKHESYIYILSLKKTELTREVLVDINCRNLKNVYFEKNPNFKKYNNFTFHDYLPQFCSENRNWLSYNDEEAATEGVL